MTTPANLKTAFVAIIVLASAMVFVPLIADDSDAATDLGTYTGGTNLSTQDAAYSGIDIDSVGTTLPSNKVFYVTLGADVSLTLGDENQSFDCEDNDLGLYNDDMYGSVSGTVSGYGCVEIFADYNYSRFYILIVSLDPNGMTDLGSYDSSVNVSSPTATYSGITKHGNWFETIYVSLGAVIDVREENEPLVLSLSNGDMGIHVWKDGDTDQLGGTVSAYGSTEVSISYSSGGYSYTIACLEPVITYAIIFDSNGGSNVPNQIIESGQTALAPSNPSLEGYVFDCWSTSPDTRVPYDFNTPVTQDMTLYAVWVETLVFTTTPTSQGTVSAVPAMAGTILCDATGSRDYTSLLWDLGDGTLSTDNYVTHYYSEPGTYTVTLTTYNSQGADVTTFTVDVPEAPGGEDCDGLLLWIAVGLLALLIVVVIATRLL